MNHYYLTDLDVIEMVRENERYKLLVDALFDNAVLYGTKDLTIDQYHFIHVLKLICPERYALVVEKLRKEAEGAYG